MPITGETQSIKDYYKNLFAHPIKTIGSLFSKKTDPFSPDIASQVQPVTPAPQQPVQSNLPVPTASAVAPTSPVPPTSTFSPTPQVPSPVTPQAPAKQIYRIGGDIFDASTNQRIPDVATLQRDYAGAQEISAPATTQAPVAPQINAATGGITTPPTIPTPTPAPQAPTGPTPFETAAESFEQALRVTPEEEKTQEELSGVLSATRLGIAGKEGQGRAIPLGLIRGQQKQLETQGLLLAEPISDKLARLQAKRTASIEASKFRLGLEAEKEKEAREAAKPERPISVAPGATLVDPSTGKPVFAAPKAAERPISVSPGAALVDPATGKPIFTAPAAEKDKFAGMPTSYKEWQISGAPGTYQDWVKKTGLRPLPAAQTAVLSEGFQIPLVTTSIDDILINKSNLFGPVEGLKALNPWDVKHKTVDDDLRRASQVIGRYMEGGVLRKEDEEKYRKMLPQITDTVAVAKDKLKGVKDLLRRKSLQYISDYEAAGFDVSGFMGKLPGTKGLGGSAGESEYAENW